MIAVILAALFGIVLGYLLAARSLVLYTYRRALMDVMTLMNESTKHPESDDAFSLRLQVAGMIASFDAWRRHG